MKYLEKGGDYVEKYLLYKNKCIFFSSLAYRIIALLLCRFKRFFKRSGQKIGYSLSDIISLKNFDIRKIVVICKNVIDQWHVAFWQGGGLDINNHTIKNYPAVLIWLEIHTEISLSLINVHCPYRYSTFLALRLLHFLRLIFLVISNKNWWSSFRLCKF